MLIDAGGKRGLSQANVAAWLKAPQSYVSKRERGERRVVEFMEFARAIEIDVAGFLEKLQ